MDGTAVHRWRGRRAPRQRGLIGPLVMLAGGVAAGVVLWRLLMLGAGADPAVDRAERLSQHDRQALERLFEQRSTQR